MDWAETWERVKKMDQSGMIESIQPGYAHKIVTFHPDKIKGLTRQELMCIADQGIPPFGGAMIGDHTVKIYTD